MKVKHTLMIRAEAKTDAQQVQSKTDYSCLKDFGLSEIAQCPET